MSDETRALTLCAPTAWDDWVVEPNSVERACSTCEQPVWDEPGDGIRIEARSGSVEAVTDVEIGQGGKLICVECASTDERVPGPVRLWARDALRRRAARL